MILPVRSTRYIHTRMRIVRAEVVTFTYVQSTIKWRRSKWKSPRWTWILLSEGQTLPYYTKGTSRTKIRPSHVKSIVFRPLIWAVESFILKKKKMEKIAVWPISVYTASDGF